VPKTFVLARIHTQFGLLLKDSLFPAQLCAP